MFRALALLAAVLLISAQTSPSRPNLQVGQVWSIKSDTPNSARVIVGRIEPFNGRVAVSVSIVDVPVPGSASGGVMAISHMPFDQDALEASLDQLLADGASPDPNFEAGYQQWRSAHGGIFTISVQQAIEIALGMLPPNARPPAASAAPGPT